MRRTILLAAVLAVAAAACSVDFGSSTEPVDGATLRSSSAPIPRSREPVAAVVDRVLPSVVSVTTDVFRTDFAGNPTEGQGVGTGFVVAEGVVVTNCHVIEGASKITVSSSDDQPDRYDARVIGGDCENDLAVLEVDAPDLPTVALAESGDVRLGQRVVALGYALGLEGGPTVTTGIVSSLERTIQAEDPGCPVSACPDGVRTYPTVIQTDAAINPGNSGGPLVDMQGRVVGINTAGNDGAENIGFAIPIDRAKPVIEEAIAEPLAAAAYLGVSTRDNDPDVAFELDLPVEDGVVVLATTGDGPAEAAGIEQGDVILAIGNREIDGSSTLQTVLGDLSPGDTVDVEVVHGDGDRETVEVTLGTRPLPVDDLP
jgi:S1-C subfamily serine protease